MTTRTIRERPYLVFNAFREPCPFMLHYDAARC
jgi:hypothetical protein